MTPPKNVQPFPKQPQIMGEYAYRQPRLEDLVKPLFSKKDFNNRVHAAFNDTEAAKIANSLADMEIDVAKKDGTSEKQKVISGTAFNSYVSEHFPNVEFNHVSNYISIADATGSLTTYYVQQQAYEKANQVAELKEQSGQDQAPDMGV